MGHCTGYPPGLAQDSPTSGVLVHTPTRGLVTRSVMRQYSPSGHGSGSARVQASPEPTGSRQTPLDSPPSSHTRPGSHKPDAPPNAQGSSSLPLNSASRVLHVPVELGSS